MLLGHLYPELELLWTVRHRGTFYRNYTADVMNLDDEELRMNLHEDSFGFDYLGTTHVGANGQTLADKPIQRFANVADDVCLLFEIQFLPLLSSCQINTENAIFDYTTIVN